MTTLRQQMEQRSQKDVTTTRVAILKAFADALALKFPTKVDLKLDEMREPDAEWADGPWKIVVDTGNIYHWQTQAQDNNAWYPATVEVEVIVSGKPSQKRQIQNFVDQIIYWIRNSRPFGDGTRSHPRISSTRIPRNLNQTWPYAEVIDIELDCRLGNPTDNIIEPGTAPTEFELYWYQGTPTLVELCVDFPQTSADPDEVVVIDDSR